MKIRMNDHFRDHIQATACLVARWEQRAGGTSFRNKVRVGNHRTVYVGWGAGQSSGEK